MTPVKLCKRGHELTPENIGKNRACKKCKALSNQTPEAKAYFVEYGKTPKKKAYYAAYHQIPKNKARDVAMRQTVEFKERHRLQNNAYTESVGDCYVAKVLRMRTGQLSQDLIEIKRLTIQLQRSIKNGNQI